MTTDSPDEDPVLRRVEEAGQRVDALRTRFELLRRRLGRSDGLADVQRLESSLRRRRSQLSHLDAQMQKMERERRKVADEIAGVLAGADALLTDLVDRLEAVDGETWSPTPVVGFTQLTADRARLHDGDVEWHAPTMTGSCARKPGAPHRNRACEGVSCGITAWKSRASFSDLTGDTLVVAARLELTGTVIEHERGYRAQEASIRRIVASDGRRWLRTSNIDQIGRLVAAPADTFASTSAPIPTDSMLLMEIDLYLGPDDTT